MERLLQTNALMNTIKEVRPQLSFDEVLAHARWMYENEVPNIKEIVLSVYQTLENTNFQAA